MRILLLITNIKQDAPRRESNLEFCLRAFSGEPGRRILEAGAIPGKMSSNVPKTPRLFRKMDSI